MNSKFALILGLALVPFLSPAINLCQQLLDISVEHADRAEIRKFKANAVYFPTADRAGYSERGGEDVLMTLERMELSLDAVVGQFLLINTMAFPAGTAAPNQWKVTHPYFIDQIRATGNKTVYALSPAYLNETKDGACQMETWDHNDATGPRLVIAKADLVTLPKFTVRGRNYDRVRRIKYANPPRISESLDASPPFVRTVETSEIEYYAPGAGQIRRETHSHFIDRSPTTTAVIRESEHVTVIDYEPVRPGSLVAGIFAEHLSTIAVKRTPEDFLNSFTGLPGFTNLSGKQRDAIHIVAQTARSFPEVRFTETVESDGFRAYVKAQGFTAAQVNTIYERAQAFFYR